MPWQKSFDQSEVLDRAMQAFWAHGFEATSMQDLVDCTGVHRGSLYATFGDKRTLFISALRTYDAQFRGGLLVELEREAAPLEAIERLLRVFVDRLGQPGLVPGCFLTNTALELAMHDIEIGRIVAHAQEQVQAFFARMIARGQARGEISQSVNSARAAAALLASLIGLAVLARSRPDPDLLNGVIDQAMASVRIES
ncbi:TetR/AcrR family transcriptional regulator [Brevundimonas sp.]|uniref:TetR/AcrR family transcriptional regulator n=1 Tax=Brevundimonas sp. TaxID=1871086 RepID=UPI003F71A13C